MNNKLSKWEQPFECPSETQQIGELQRDRETIRQSAEIKQSTLNGLNQVAFAQVGQIINISYNKHLTKNTEDILKKYLQSLPEQEKFVASWLQSLPQPRLKNAIKEIMRILLNVFMDNHTATAAFLGTSRHVVRYRFPKFTRDKEEKYVYDTDSQL